MTTAVLYLASFVVTVVFSPWTSLLVYAVVGAAFGVFVFATSARTYVPLATDEPAGGPVAAAT